jgi:GxxExxY protein
MPIVSPAGAVTRRADSEIFLQRDREIGRFFGFTPQPELFRATPALGDRQDVVIDDDFSLSERVIGACIEVHRELGPGLLESIYEECLCRDLAARGLSFERQKPISVAYEGDFLDQAYRIDLVVEDELLLEIKAVDSLLPIHAAQVVTYLRITGLPSGLLVNFNAMTIRDGLRRLWRTPKNLPISRSLCKKI